MQSKNKILGGVLNIFLRVQKGAKAKNLLRGAILLKPWQSNETPELRACWGPRKSVRQTWVEKQFLASELAKKLQELKLINI